MYLMLIKIDFTHMLYINQLYLYKLNNLNYMDSKLHSNLLRYLLDKFACKDSLMCQVLSLRSKKCILKHFECTFSNLYNQNNLYLNQLSFQQDNYLSIDSNRILESYCSDSRMCNFLMTVNTFDMINRKYCINLKFSQQMYS